MKKINDVELLLADYGIVLEHDTVGQFMGRHVRYLESYGIFQVGDNNFDRWANSVDKDLIFEDLHQTKGVRRLQRWLEACVEADEIVYL